jgi:hypothetical protein
MEPCYKGIWIENEYRQGSYYDDFKKPRHNRIRVNDTFVKEVDKVIYLGSEINSEGKTVGEVSRQMRNISESCQL